jgi:hypothetical protein
LKQKRKITSTSRATLEDMRMTKAHQVNFLKVRLGLGRLGYLKRKRKITSTSRATLEDMRMTKAHQVYLKKVR